MRRVALASGIELAVHEFGEGAPVLLLHAWGETHRTFQRVVALLPRSLHLIVPDQRGVGESTKPPTGYGVRDAADDAVALMDALELAACWLVGTSSGGYVAQQVAAEHPERVRGLVLVGAPSDLSGPLPGSLSDALAAFHDPPTRGDIESINGALPVHTPVATAFLDDQLLAALSIPRHVWQAVAAGLVSATPPIRTARISAPTLILAGAEDDVLPADQADELARAIAGSRLVMYERTGHLVLWEQPDRVAADVAAFIASTDG